MALGPGYNGEMIVTECYAIVRFNPTLSFKRYQMVLHDPVMPLYVVGRQKVAVMACKTAP